jgi:hypothetical protein
MLGNSQVNAGKWRADGEDQAIYRSFRGGHKKLKKDLVERKN